MTKHDQRISQERTRHSTSKAILNPSTGEVLQVKGAGSLAGHGLVIQKGVDLTKPIFEQVRRKR